MEINLGEIEILNKKLKVDINLKNTTEKVLKFYPNQGSAIINDMQLDANLFLTYGKVGGNVHGGVKQDETLQFLVLGDKKINIESVKEIKLIFGNVNTDDYMTSEPVEFVIRVEL